MSNRLVFKSLSVSIATFALLTTWSLISASADLRVIMLLFSGRTAATPAVPLGEDERTYSCNMTNAEMEEELGHQVRASVPEPATKTLPSEVTHGRWIWCFESATGREVIGAHHANCFFKGGMSDQEFVNHIEDQVISLNPNLASEMRTLCDFCTPLATGFRLP